MITAALERRTVMAKAIKMTAIAFLKTDPALLFEMIYRGAKVEIIYPRGAIISKHEVFAEKILKCIYDNVDAYRKYYEFNRDYKYTGRLFRKQTYEPQLIDKSDPKYVARQIYNMVMENINGE